MKKFHNTTVSRFSSIITAKKNLLTVFCFTIILIIAGCHMKESIPDKLDQITHPIDLENKTQFSVQQHQVMLKAIYQNSCWILNQRPSQLATLLVAEFSNLTGTKIEEPKDTQEHLILHIEKEDYIITKNDNAFYLNKGQHFFKLNNVGPLIKNFDSLIFSGDMIRPDLKEPFHEILFTSDNFSYLLTTQSNLSEVEKAPLISGWFIREYYNKDMPLSYNEASYVIPLLDELRAQKLTERLTYTTPQLSLQFDSEKHPYTLFNSDGQYYIENMEGDQWRLPNITGDFLTKPVLEKLDPFISLIMADALTSVTINTTDQEWLIKADHNKKENQEPQISFQINGKPIEDKSFRKLYQYIAVLSANEEYKDQAITDQSILDIQYHFLSEKEAFSHTLVFYPLQNNPKKAAVMLDHSIDFIIDTEQIDQMLHQLKSYKS